MRPGRIRRAQPRDTRGRYTRRPQLPVWGWAVCLAFAVLLVVIANL